MFFPNKNIGLIYGDHRSVKKFAFFPTTLVDVRRKEVGIIWFGWYDRVQIFYGKYWDKSYATTYGNGKELARAQAAVYGGRVINEG